MKKIGIIGLGNPLRSDDGIGIILLNKIIEQKNILSKNIEYIDGGTGGINLINDLVKFDIILFIDAIDFKGKIGETIFLEQEELVSKKILIRASTHQNDILKILQLSKSLNELPEKIFFYGIQIKDTSIGSNLSDEINEKFNEILNNLIIDINRISEDNI
jgi:hydrogenase maturation protease